jgi:hypothetical protein
VVDDGRVGYVVVEEEPDKLVEECVEIVPAGQVVVLVDDPVVDQADGLQLRFAAVPDRDLNEPGGGLQLDPYDGLTVVRLGRERPPGHIQPGPRFSRSSMAVANICSGKVTTATIARPRLTACVGVRRSGARYSERDASSGR